jgi:magnesium chelatase accessory protein
MASLDWSRDKAGWPHAQASRFVDAAGWRWHVQHLRPAHTRSAGYVLLLHGTGASAHSFRQLAPLLAQRFDVLVPDLPGHAFTRATSARSVTLPAVAEAVAALLRALQAQPAAIVGHSAGAAIGAQMCLADLATPRQLVSINGALLPLQGLVQQWFSPLAKWLVVNPLVPHLFAWQAAQPAVVRKLLASTGSQIDDEGAALYGRLVADPRHAAGALRLMASWHLAPLAAALPRLLVPLTLLVGSRDGTVPPAQAQQVQQRLPQAQCVWLEGLGHLAHEEDPARVLAALPLAPADLEARRPARRA